MGRRHSYFSIEEANGMVPTLDHYFRERALTMRQLHDLRKILLAAGASIDNKGINLPRAAGPLVVDARDAYLDFCKSHDLLMEELLGIGIEIVDVEAGVVNFYSWWDGEEVVFSWQYGEPTVSFWIDPGESFGARRPLTQLFFDAPVGHVLHH